MKDFNNGGYYIHSEEKVYDSSLLFLLNFFFCKHKSLKNKIY